MQIAVMGSYGADGTIDINELKENLKQTEGVTEADNITTLPAKVTVDGYQVNIDKNGKVTIYGEDISGGNNDLVTTATLQEAIEKDAPLSKTENTVLEDKYKNVIVLPAGFKINSESADNVTGGVVIEDVSHGATAGSEFVWIPVGTVYMNETGTASETINLSRYTFAEDGTATVYGEKPIAVNNNNEPCDPNDENYLASFEEKSKSDLGNKVALSIENFKTKATKNHGYYIGRYVAKTPIQRTSKIDELKQITVKRDDFIYDYVTEIQAASKSQEMYNGETKFTSDLMNSYAWDTAIVFLQIFDDRENNTKPYSRQTSSNSGKLAIQGTNHLEIEKQDKICNIWDMASNVNEWITETYSNSDVPCVARSGRWDTSIGYTSARGGGATNSSSDHASFRPIIYLQN